MQIVIAKIVRRKMVSQDLGKMPWLETAKADEADKPT